MVPSSSPNAAAGPGNSCKSVYILGANGSGQSTNSVNDSPEVKSVVQAIKTELDKAKVSSDIRSIRYPAISTNVLKENLRWGDILTLRKSYNQFTQTNLPKYAASIAEGVSATYRALSEIRNGCLAEGKTPIIALVGYSQGAMAIHEGLNAFADSPRDTELVRAAVLLADPGRMPNSTVVNIGSASRGPVTFGLCPLGDKLKAPCADVQTREVDPRFHPITTQVCWRGDIVCDTATAAGNANAFSPGSATAGIAIHTSKALYAGTLTKSLGTRIGQRLALESATRTPTPGPAPNPNLTPAPTLNPTTGPVGTIVSVSANRSCPPGSAQMRVEMTDGNGKLLSLGYWGLNYGLNGDGSPVGPTPLYTAPANDQVHGGFDAPLGRYNVTTSCYNSDGRESDKSAPASFTFDAPPRTATPHSRTVVAGGELRLSAPPCLLNKNGIGEGQQVTAKLWGPLDGTGDGSGSLKVHGNGVGAVTDRNGNWATAIPVPVDADPGAYALAVQCEGSKPGASFIPGLQYRHDIGTITVTKPGTVDPTPVG
ncbi:cutinase family protein [Actinomycetospora soli]|uniref:cutinase family protein n=1 Tax=Actinomycetospora soli TaxID=2893887 RepID=UPI001E61F9D4|nr:cutinase family protein [Actinomycetospora soli]MCD2191358.1 cutinase family protein [Actinomycetospora soli]